MKKIAPVLFLLLNLPLNAQNDSIDATLDIFYKHLDSIEKTFVYQHGSIQIGDGIATINVPEGFKFLNAKDSEMVLTEFWGNPPSEVLGMLLPENMSPMSEDFTYAIEITYSDEGYIKDDDAEDIDYDDLLKEMQKDAVEENKSRVEMGYEPIQIIGWAAKPFYDATSKKLHWAKELKFGETEINTLNYNIRILGRKGYLNLNAIGDMEILPLVQTEIDKVLSSTEFNKGYKYSEYDSSIDKVAAYGIGGLIAGKVLAKAGLFAVLLKFSKIILLAVAGFFGVFRKKLFGSKKEVVETKETGESTLENKNDATE